MQIHEVTARRFCLVSADHPLVSAIAEKQALAFEPPSLPELTSAVCVLQCGEAPEYATFFCIESLYCTLTRFPSVHSGRDLNDARRFGEGVR